VKRKKNRWVPLHIATGEFLRLMSKCGARGISWRDLVNLSLDYRGQKILYARQQIERVWNRIRQDGHVVDIINVGNLTFYWQASLNAPAEKAAYSAERKLSVESQRHGDLNVLPDSVLSPQKVAAQTRARSAEEAAMAATDRAIP